MARAGRCLDVGDLPTAHGDVSVACHGLEYRYPIDGQCRHEARYCDDLCGEERLIEWLRPLAATSQFQLNQC
ncbi:hypothetical protein Poly21_13490 [Allorhodopirellula heiligendammensis]|uniref:Uncharacterized protein n=1 Tax=Allorhodopirellula heiligendammensis TaxID=2714739 RepID=A0A5C6C4R1_9BACT|nr:hypothetical protein Poly21_13490 [Allorhodopirellula heiligendammensis]